MNRVNTRTKRRYRLIVRRAKLLRNPLRSIPDGDGQTSLLPFRGSRENRNIKNLMYKLFAIGSAHAGGSARQLLNDRKRVPRDGHELLKVFSKNGVLLP